MSLTLDSSIKPYLLRAFYSWSSDQGFVPYIVVLINQNVKIPRQYGDDSTITLNIAPKACQDLVIDNHWVLGTMRFSGVAHQVAVPITNVLGIFVKENNQSIEFLVESDPPAKISPVPHCPSPKPSSSPSKAALRLIK